MLMAFKSKVKGIGYQKASDCVLAAMCVPPTELCHLGGCEKCPGYELVIDTFQEAMWAEGIESVKVNKWQTENGRCSLVPLEMDSNDFLETFQTELEVLQEHRYIAMQQSEFLEIKIKSLKKGEIVVIYDFAENYTITNQDEVQSAHFNQIQATVHVAVVFFKDEEDQCQEISHVVISNHLTHGTAEVHLFQKLLFDRLKEMLPFELLMVWNFSDNCASQYKNKKNFVNILHHEADFGVKIEWHFFERYHGKGRCDGIGGAVKRNAQRASLQKVGLDKINTPLRVFQSR